MSNSDLTDVSETLVISYKLIIIDLILDSLQMNMTLFQVKNHERTLRKKNL